MTRFLSLLIFIVLSAHVNAEPIEVEYKRFYSHINKIGDEDTAALQFAFGFLRVGEDRLCPINSAKIVTQKQTIALEVSKEHRFLVPKERALKLADASILIDLAEAANVCDMSVQIETKAEYVKKEYTAEELAYITRQYEAFFNEMGGFLSFMMPSVNGLIFRFSDTELDAPIPGTSGINNGMLMLDKEWLERGNGLRLPEAPLRITAIAKG